MKITNKVAKSMTAALTITLAGCSTLDQMTLANSGRYEPNAIGFVFTSQASTNMQEDSPGAERNRLKVLDKYVQANETCKDGYEIVSREVIRHPPTFLGVKTKADIVYTGVCK